MSSNLIHYDITCTEDLKDIIEYHILGEEVRPDIKLSKLHFKNEKAGFEINLQNENVAVRWNRKDLKELSRSLLSGITFTYCDGTKVFVRIVDYPDPVVFIFINFTSPDVDLINMNEKGIFETVFGVQYKYSELQDFGLYNQQDLKARKDFFVKKLRKNSKLELVLWIKFRYHAENFNFAIGIDSKSHQHLDSSVYDLNELIRFKHNTFTVKKDGVSLSIRKKDIPKLSTDDHSDFIYRGHVIDNQLLSILPISTKGLFREIVKNLDESDIKNEKIASWVLAQTLED